VKLVDSAEEEAEFGFRAEEFVLSAGELITFERSDV
jgi:hypothetical protein